MDPTLQAQQTMQLQNMYGAQGGPPQGTHPMQFQPFQVQQRPLPPSGGGQQQGAPSPPPSQGSGGGGGQQGGGWAQTLMPLMKGMMQRGQPQGPQMQGPPMPGPQLHQPMQQPMQAPMMPPGGVEMSGTANGIVNSWPYAR